MPTGDIATSLYVKGPPQGSCESHTGLASEMYDPGSRRLFSQHVAIDTLVPQTLQYEPPSTPLYHFANQNLPTHISKVCGEENKYAGGPELKCFL